MTTTAWIVPLKILGTEILETQIKFRFIHMKGLDSNFIILWEYDGLTANILSEAKTGPLKLILFVCFCRRITGGLVQIITRLSL